MTKTLEKALALVDAQAGDVDIGPDDLETVEIAPDMLRDLDDEQPPEEDEEGRDRREPPIGNVILNALSIVATRAWPFYGGLDEDPGMDEWRDKVLGHDDGLGACRVITEEDCLEAEREAQRLARNAQSRESYARSHPPKPKPPEDPPEEIAPEAKAMTPPKAKQAIRNAERRRERAEATTGRRSAEVTDPAEVEAIWMAHKSNGGSLSYEGIERDARFDLKLAGGMHAYRVCKRHQKALASKQQEVAA